MQENYRPFNKTKKKQIDTTYLFSQKELTIFIVAVLCVLLIYIFPKGNSMQTMIAVITIALIIPLTFLIKKNAAHEHAIQIEHRFWVLSRFGFKETHYIKNPLPLGIILPLFITIVSGGYIKPLTFFQFDAENMRTRRLLKAKGYRRGLRKELMNESDFAMTAALGMYAILTYAISMYILTFFTDLSFFADSGYYALVYGAWNLIPASQLDGAKIFFGSFITWTMLILLFVGMFTLIAFF